MTVRLLYQEGSVFVNHSYLYIICNTEQILKPEKTLFRMGLIV